MSPKSQINFNFLAISTQVMIMIPLLKSVPGHVINRRQDALSRKKKKKKGGRMGRREVLGMVLVGCLGSYLIRELAGGL